MLFRSTRDSGGSPHITAYTHARKNKIAVDDPFDDNTLIGTYCDADLAGDEDTRKSTSGLVIMMHGGAICWSSRFQNTCHKGQPSAPYTLVGSDKSSQTCITRSLRKVQWVAMPRMLAFKVSRLMIIQEKPFGLVVLNIIMAATGTGILGLVNLSWVDLSSVVMISM